MADMSFVPGSLVAEIEPHADAHLKTAAHDLEGLEPFAPGLVDVVISAIDFEVQSTIDFAKRIESYREQGLSHEQALVESELAPETFADFMTKIAHREGVIFELRKHVESCGSWFDEFTDDPTGVYLDALQEYTGSSRALMRVLFFMEFSVADDMHHGLNAINVRQPGALKTKNDHHGKEFSNLSALSDLDPDDPLLKIRDIVLEASLHALAINEVKSIYGEFEDTFEKPIEKIEELAAIQYADLIAEVADRKSAFDSIRIKDNRQLLRDLEQPPSNGAKKPQPIHQAIPQRRAEDMLKLVLAIDENMTGTNARQVKAETIARRLQRFADEEAHLVGLKDIIQAVVDNSDEELDDKPAIAKLFELGKLRSLQDIIDDLADNYEKSDNGNGIKASVREHLGRDTANRVSEVVAALRDSKKGKK